MCRFNDAELYCVSTNILLIPEFRQLEMGISTKRYLPAIGTAGLERLAVKGYKRVPAPPPSMTAKIDFDINQTVLYGDTVNSIKINPSLLFYFAVTCS